jgi:ComF family protein
MPSSVATPHFSGEFPAVNAFFNAVFPTRCPLCRAYLTTETGLCKTCLERIGTAQLEGNLLHLGQYHGTLERAVMALKFGGNRSVATPLAHALTRGIREANWRVDALVPLPLHTNRETERTYNQAGVIARAIGVALNTPVLNALERTRDTQRQARLEKRQREDNIRGAFCVARPVQGLELILVDDVYTSGATTTEASIALIERGAKRVRIVTLARARNARD